MTEERRSAPRVPAQHPVLMETQEPGTPGAIIHSDTDDLSAAAFRCVCDQALPPFARVEVVIKLPDSAPDQPGDSVSIECDGIVVRREDVEGPEGSARYRVAVFLDHTTPEQRALLDRVVGQHLAGSDPPAGSA